MRNLYEKLTRFAEECLPVWVEDNLPTAIVAVSFFAIIFLVVIGIVL